MIKNFLFSFQTYLIKTKSIKNRRIFGCPDVPTAETEPVKLIQCSLISFFSDQIVHYIRLFLTPQKS